MYASQHQDDWTTATIVDEQPVFPAAAYVSTGWLSPSVDVQSHHVLAATPCTARNPFRTSNLYTIS
jgi:hypothetical protein